MAEQPSLMEWLGKAKEDPKLAASPVVVIVALIFFGWKFFYAPQKIALAKELKSNKGVEKQIQALEQAVANKEQIQLEVNDFRKAMEKAEKICYKKSESPVFLQSLKKLGKQAQLDIKNINPQAPVEKTFETLKYEEYPVKINFQGTISQLGIFLRTLEIQEKLIVLALPQLTPDASGTFKFDLLPTVFLLPDHREEAAPLPAGGG